MNDDMILGKKWQDLKFRLKSKKFMQPAVWLWRLMKFTLFQGPAYIDAFMLLRKFISEKHDDEIMLIFCIGIGDTLYGMSMIDGVLEKFPDKKIVIIANSRHQELLESYPKNDRITFRFKQHSKSYTCRHFHFVFSRGLQEKGWAKNVIFCLPDSYKIILGHVINSPRFIGTIYRLRRNIFELPDDTPIRYHGFKPDSSIISIPDFEALKHKIVLIHPYSNSTWCTMSIYDEISRQLNRRGYMVFTNVVGEQRAAEGSIPLRCGLREVYSIACNIPLVVSVRSGFLDFIVPYGVNIFAVYDRTEYFRLTYPLSEWAPSGKLEEVLVNTPEEAASIPEKFLRFLDELRAEGRIS